MDAISKQNKLVKSYNPQNIWKQRSTVNDLYNYKFFIV